MESNVTVETQDSQDSKAATHPGRYWTMTKEELIQEAIAAGVTDFNINNRKETIKKIRIAKGELSDYDPDLDPKNYVVVRFHNRSEQDLPYVVIGLNGKTWYVPKEKDVLIPKALLGVIDDAIETVFVQAVDPNTSKRIIEEKKIMRFPYTIIKKWD